MNKLTGIFLLVLMVACGTIFAGILRKIVFHFAFLGKSKTAKRKIQEEHSKFLQKCLLLYVPKYNNRGLTIWALVCYYIFCLGSLATIGGWIVVLLGKGDAIPLVFWNCVEVVWRELMIVSILSLLIKPKHTGHRHTRHTGDGTMC